MSHTDPSDFDTGLAPEDLDPARPRTLETPWGAFALFVVEGRILCVQSFCPHLGGPLFQGTVSGAKVACPWHEWVFSLETGQRVDLAGRILGGGAVLARCAVSYSARGTVLLRAPDRRPRV
ncbi:MAG: Rieske 2Fe-2S domain-containing protein [Planctomycetota bacterium]|nr:Rieske 2Fe-2S domain-containing protein [Planctomycetota bacterium]